MKPINALLLPSLTVFLLLADIASSHNVHQLEARSNGTKNQTGGHGNSSLLGPKEMETTFYGFIHNLWAAAIPGRNHTSKNGTNSTGEGNHSLGEPTTLEGFIGQLWERFAPKRNHTRENGTVEDVNGHVNPRMVVPLTGQKGATGGSEREDHDHDTGRSCRSRTWLNECGREGISHR